MRSTCDTSLSDRTSTSRTSNPDARTAMIAATARAVMVGRRRAMACIGLGRWVWASGAIGRRPARRNHSSDAAARNSAASSPASRLERNRRRQIAGSSVSSILSCQARCQPSAQGPPRASDHRQHVLPRPQCQHHRRAHQRHAQHHEAAQPGPGAVAEQPRGRTNADQRVVLLVLMGIDGVVEQRPGDAGEIERQRRRRERCRSPPPRPAARPS